MAADNDWRDVIRRIWVIGDGAPSFQFDTVINEGHSSKLQIMDNPVETGFIVSDHAVMMPAALEIWGVVSDVWLGMRRADRDKVTELNTDREWLVPTDQDDADSTGRAQRAFELMTGLQESANPFDVITGLKRYSNMLIEELSANQDAKTAGALVFRAQLRGVLIVSTETVQYTPRVDTKTKKRADKTTTKGQQQATEPTTPEKKVSLARKALNAARGAS